jgi:hypothetical protein
VIIPLAPCRSVPSAGVPQSLVSQKIPKELPTCLAIFRACRLSDTVVALPLSDGLETIMRRPKFNVTLVGRLPAAHPRKQSKSRLGTYRVARNASGDVMILGHVLLNMPTVPPSRRTQMDSRPMPCATWRQSGHGLKTRPRRRRRSVQHRLNKHDAWTALSCARDASRTLPARGEDIREWAPSAERTVTLP